VKVPHLVTHISDVCHAKNRSWTHLIKGWGEAPLSQHSPVVLCVDTYEGLLITIAAVLEPFGYRTLTARSLEEAIAVASSNPPDAVLLEYRLCPGCPPTTGDCAAELLQSISPRSKILVWCADGSCFQNPPPCAAAIFMKPVEPERLAFYLDNVLGKTSAKDKRL